jgi:hypothetical protein
MNDRHRRYVRLRYTAAGALAALAAAGAIAGASALAAKPHAKPLPSPMPTKAHAPQPPVNHQVFLDAIQQLVAAGTITAAQGQAVDGEIAAGRVDTDTLAASGFTPAQLQAVQQALSGVKQGLAAARSAPPPPTSK